MNSGVSTANSNEMLVTVYNTYCASDLFFKHNLVSRWIVIYAGLCDSLDTHRCIKQHNKAMFLWSTYFWNTMLHQMLLLM